jgi:hypothetical protein
MATGLAASVVQAILDALCRSVAWVEPAAFWVKLHTGDPGAAGTANAFGDTTRKQATFAAAQADGTITTSANIDWTAVTAAGTVSHVSFWDASTGGNFLGSDDLATPRTLAIDDNFTILAGDVDLSLAPIAA